MKASMKILGAACVLWAMGLFAGPAHAQAVEYLHTDALGSIVAVTNSAGQVIERREYEPYGRQLKPTALADGPGYTGHVSDAATGLDYMQQRYYDSSLGRFLSIDPVTANRRTGANFNRYWYANNNPYRFTDPDGRLAFDDENDKPPPPPKPEEDKPEPVTLGTVSVTATRPAPAPVSIPWGKIGRTLVRGGSIPLTFITGMWPYDMDYSPCEDRAPFACTRMYNEAQPDERDLTKLKERDANMAAKDAGYEDAHDAKKGRGEGGVDIYRDKSGGRWLWSGVPSGEKGRVMTTITSGKTASLTFRGFEIDPTEIERMLGIEMSEAGIRGTPVRLGIKTLLKRSFARFSVNLSQESRLDQAIPTLLDYLGGVEKVSAVSQTVIAEFFELDIAWPVKSSDDQEGGFLPPAVISDLSILRCTLTFSFL